MFKTVILSGAGLAAFYVLMRWGIPALIDTIKKKAPPKVQDFLYDLSKPIVQIVEVISKHFDWKGEDKYLEAVKRIEEVIGRELKPDEEVVARKAISRAVREMNMAAGTTGGGESFAPFVKRRRSKGRRE